MKKVYMVGIVLLALSAAGCSFKPAQTIEETPGDIQTLTWTTEMTWAMNTATGTSSMEEFTGEFDSWVVPTVAGSDGKKSDAGVVAEVDDLIEQRNTQTKDDSKLTEEDIDLMDQIIQKIQNL